MPGSSTKASKIGESPVEGLKNRYLMPAALSCATNRAPPVPCISRVAPCTTAPAAGPAIGARFCAMALAATVLIPMVVRPDMSLRLEIPLSRYCLNNSFMACSFPFRLQLVFFSDGKPESAPDQIRGALFLTILVTGPQSGRGEFQQMPVRIAEIDTVSAARPLCSAFDLDAGFAQPFFPSLQLIGGNGKGHVGRPLAVVGRDGAARQLDGAQRLPAPEQQQDPVAADIVGMQPLVRVETGEPEDLLVERTGALEVVDIEHGLQHPVQARHGQSPPFHGFAGTAGPSDRRPLAMRRGHAHYILVGPSWRALRSDRIAP